MRKISLIPYNIGNGQMYDVRQSIINLMFAPELRLGIRDAIENDRIARKIESAENHEVILEDAEFARVKQAFDVFQGYGRNDLELIARVQDAAEITVKEA